MERADKIKVSSGTSKTLPVTSVPTQRITSQRPRRITRGRRREAEGSCSSTEGSARKISRKPTQPGSTLMLKSLTLMEKSIKRNT